jgi:Uncharacterised protein family UPF0547
MAIHLLVDKQCRKYLMPGEEIIATIMSNPFFGTETRHCLTNRRILQLNRKVLSWQYMPIPLFELRGMKYFIDDGMLRCSIIIGTGEHAMAIRAVNKSDAREFMAAFEWAVSQNFEYAAQQTKTCPECAETIKLLAKRCSHCGHVF